MTNRDLKQLAETLVRNEVRCCVSSLVSTLTLGTAIRPSCWQDGQADCFELRDLCEQAADLAAPVDDWEEAAFQAGWTVDGNLFVNHDEETSAESSPLDACGWEDLCNERNIEPYQREVFEHWAVSDQLAQDLIEVGEKVDTDFAGMCVWARTTTGQMISMDAALLRVAKLANDRANAIMENVHA